MKPYFTKYLPVEGEIKEGDHFLIKQSHPSGQLRKCWEIYKPDYGEEQLMIDNPEDPHRGYGFCLRPEVQPAKLFLCSRDIQVGDKVYYTPSNNSLNPPIEGWYIVTTVDKLILAFENNGGIVKRELCFKVIGEISPDALSYVSEGDEFDISSLRFYWNNTCIEGQEMTVKQWADNNKSIPAENLIIKIKGPCSHFH